MAEDDDGGGGIKQGNPKQGGGYVPDRVPDLTKDILDTIMRVDTDYMLAIVGGVKAILVLPLLILGVLVLSLHGSYNYVEKLPINTTRVDDAADIASFDQTTTFSSSMFQNAYTQATVIPSKNDEEKYENSENNKNPDKNKKDKNKNKNNNVEDILSQLGYQKRKNKKKKKNNETQEEQNKNNQNDKIPSQSSSPFKPATIIPHLPPLLNEIDINSSTLEFFEHETLSPKNKIISFISALMLAASSSTDFLVIRRRDCASIIFYTAISAMTFVGEIICIDFVTEDLKATQHKQHTHLLVASLVITVAAAFLTALSCYIGARIANLEEKRLYVERDGRFAVLKKKRDVGKINANGLEMIGF